MMRGVRAYLAAAIVLLGMTQAVAQTNTTGPQLGGVLVVEQEALFTQTLFGKRILALANERTVTLGQENDRIAAELEAEEAELTERRATLTPAEFRELADQFDEKVQAIRAEQRVKDAAILSALEADRVTYFQAIVPILGRLMVENGASVILDKRNVLISANIVDFTEQAVSRIDAQLGDGSDVVIPETNQENP